jgi:ligand-binding sensor domain-containing protein
MDGFAQSDGLSGDYVRSLFEDREGNVWVATLDGLDCFREFAVPTISVKQGLSNATVFSVLAAADGSVWLGTISGLNRWKDGQVTIYRERNGVPDDVAESLLQDERGRIWVFTARGVAYFANGRFIRVRGLPGGHVRSVAGNTEGNLWMGYQERGLFHLTGEGAVEVERIPWATLGHEDWTLALFPDPVQDGVWL